MPEFIFYKTAPLEVEKTLYSLVDKALKKEFNSILIFEDEERLRLVDEFLWTYKQDSFLPHLKIGDALDTELNIPVYLTTKDENPFNARIFFSIDGSPLWNFEGWRQLPRRTVSLPRPIPCRDAL